jgi:orotidine-5'-phosphate decarboxylase
MNREELFELIKQKRSFLCVGLDTDITKIPKHLLKGEDPVFDFNVKIIDATIDLAIAYKPNLAFYESLGSKGLISLEKTIGYLQSFGDEVFTIADAKRGDIGNTSKLYAKAFLDNLGFDAVTVAPYMGADSVTPFLEYPDKWVVLLALTSNKGSDDFQMLETIIDKEDTEKVKLFERVITKSYEWAGPERIMFVVGATKADMLHDIRKIAPDHFLLIPGVGAQGGSLDEVAKYGMNAQCGILVNASRSIIYASSGEDFAEKAREEAINMQQQMSVLLENIIL